MKLNKEEKEILASYERGEWKTVKGKKREIKKFSQLAKTALKSRHIVAK